MRSYELGRHTGLRDRINRVFDLEERLYAWNPDRAGLVGAGLLCGPVLAGVSGAVAFWYPAALTGTVLGGLVAWYARAALRAADDAYRLVGVHLDAGTFPQLQSEHPENWAGYMRLRGLHLERTGATGATNGGDATIIPFRRKNR